MDNYDLDGELYSIFYKRRMSVSGFVILTALSESVIAHRINSAIIFEHNNMVILMIRKELLPVSMLTDPLRGSTVRLTPSFVETILLSLSNSLMMGY